MLKQRRNPCPRFKAVNYKEFKVSEPQKVQIRDSAFFSKGRPFRGLHEYNFAETYLFCIFCEATF